MPGRGDFGEVTSTSNTTDYQARRLAIRYRKEGGRPQLLHTLNGTALAISRALISLLEIYQQQDGSVMLPEVLVPYVGRERLTSS
jgi:seryl-tRNA synthetase